MRKDMATFATNFEQDWPGGLASLFTKGKLESLPLSFELRHSPPRLFATSAACRSVKKAMARHDRLFKKARHSGSPRLWEAYKSQRNATTAKIKRAHNNYVRNIMGPVSTDQDKADTLNNLFHNAFTSENLDSLPNLENPSSPRMCDISFTVPRVCKLLRNLQSHKAASPDALPPHVLHDGCFTNVSRALQNNLAKIHNARNHISGENFKLKLCMCAQSMALDTCTKFQLEILISTISAIHKFREIILESSRKVSETTPWLLSSLDQSVPCFNNSMTQAPSCKPEGTPWYPRCTRKDLNTTQVTLGQYPWHQSSARYKSISLSAACFLTLRITGYWTLTSMSSTSISLQRPNSYKPYTTGRTPSTTKAKLMSYSRPLTKCPTNAWWWSWETMVWTPKRTPGLLHYYKTADREWWSMELDPVGPLSSRVSHRVHDRSDIVSPLHQRHRHRHQLTDETFHWW